MTNPSPITTVEQLRALKPDGRRHELLDGVHVNSLTPWYTHQRMVGALFLTFGNALAGRADLELLPGPAELVLGPTTLVQPDLVAFRKTPGTPVRSWVELGVPILVVEVLGPDTSKRDRGPKRVIYQRAGIAEYWIVDLDDCVVERWRPDATSPEILRQTLAWQPDESAEPFVVSLPGFFGSVLGID